MRFAIHNHFITRVERFGWLWWGLALLALLGQGVAIWLNAYNGVPDYTDFLALYASAKAWGDGLSLLHPYTYTPFFGHIAFVIAPDPAFASDNLNFPLLAVLMAPITWLELRSAYYLWCAVQLASALAVWIWLLSGVSRAWQGFAVLLMALYFPVFANALIGQNGLWLFVVIGLFLGSLQRGQIKRAAFWLGLALLFKLFVGLLFIWLLLRRQWRMVFMGGVVWGLGVLVSIAILGVQPHLEWGHLLVTHKIAALNWNASWQGAVVRYVPDTLSAVWAVAAAWLVCLAGLCYLAWRKADMWLGVALCLPMMLFLSPLGWLYYFPILLLAGWCFVQTGGYAQRGPALLFLLGWLCSAVPQFLATTSQGLGNIILTRGIDADIKVENGQLVTYYANERTWLVLPEIYMLALVFIMIAVCWLSYKEKAKSTVSGM
jgi:hypothetical protein